MGKQAEASKKRIPLKRKNRSFPGQAPNRRKPIKNTRSLSEAALRESEEKYRTVVNSANDGIAIIQDQIIQFANPRLAEMAGYSPGEIVGRPFADFLRHEEIQEFRTPTPAA